MLIQKHFDNLLNFLNSLLEKKFLFKYFITQISNKNIFSLNNFFIILLSLIIIYTAILCNKYLSSKLLPIKKSTNIINIWIYNIFTQIYIILLALLSLIILFNISQNYNFSALLLITLISIWIILINTFLFLLKYIFPKYLNNNSNKKTLFITALLFMFLWYIGFDDVIIKILKSYNIVIDKNKLNFYTIVYNLLIVTFIIFISIQIANIINSIIIKTFRFDDTIKIIFSNIVKTCTLTIGILIIMPILGIDITALAVFGGAFGASLGLCLKNIVSNYLSGFIILLERSIKINDKITIDNFTGYVTKITSRFIVLTNSTSGKEALVPNDAVMSKTIINESYSNKLVKSFISVQVAYDTYIPKALEILNNAIQNQNKEYVSKLQPPSARITGFDQNGINLELDFYVLDKQDDLNISNTDIYLYIWQEFYKNNIKFYSSKKDIFINNDAINVKFNE